MLKQNLFLGTSKKRILQLVLPILLCVSANLMAQTNVDWWKQPHRFLQFNLQVKDAAEIDPEEIIRYAKEELRAEAIMLNAGGIYAWYPSEVPFHQKNPHMGDRDIFGDFVKAADKYDLKILARVDFSKTTEKTYAAHPEWFVLDKDGLPNINTLERPGDWDKLILTDGNGPYRNEAVAMPVLREIITKYDVDAFFFSFASYTLSHGPYSQNKYNELYGTDIPKDTKKRAPDWRQISYYNTWKNWHKVIKETNSDVAIIGRTRMDQRETIEFMSKYSDVISTQPRDAYQDGWGNQDPRWKAAIETNFARSAMNNGERPLILTNTAPGLAWRHTSLPKAEFDFWMAQIIANGGNWLPSTTGFPAVMEDMRTLENVGAFNREIEKVQPYLTNNIKKAKVAILNSSRNFKQLEEELNGFFETLINHQIQFDVIAEYNLLKDGLKGYDLLILADQKVLTNTELEAIESFIKKGGKTLTTFETGLYDENGKSRERAFFDEPLGIKGRFQKVHKVAGSYMRIEDQSSPLLKNIGNTKILPYGGELINTSGIKPYAMTLVPPFAPVGKWGNPPERASFRKSSTEVPLVHANNNHIHFTSEIGKFVWDHRLPDHQKLLANAVFHLVPDAAPIKTMNYKSVMVNIFKRDKGYMIFLVNNSGERPMNEPVILKDLLIEWKAEGRIKSVKSVLNDQTIEFSEEKNRIQLVIPQLKTWEVIYAE